MKKLQMFMIVLCCAMSISAQNYTKIQGKVKLEGRMKLSEVTLYKTVDGAQQVYATTQIAPDGSYGFLMVPETPGFYTVGGKNIAHIIYIKGGEEINIDILDTKGELNGKNSKENEALYQWEDFSHNIRLKSVYFMLSRSNYKDFFPEFSTFVKEVPALKSKIKSGNPEFDKLLQFKIDYDVDYYATIFLQTPRSIHPKKTDWPAYYKTIIATDKYTTDEVLQLPLGVRMISCYASFAYQQKEYKSYSMDKYLAELGNDRLKGEYVLSSSRNLKSYDAYLEMMDKYGKYFVTPSQKSRAEAIGVALYDSAPGKDAADFTYPDVNGKQVSLSDFKGKVVLVDVWATWCGPCRGQIPALKKLEEEMHGEEVVFIGVSVDEAKDKQKWLDFVKKEELKGIQLHASGWSKIAKDYKITGIPRFMVFDKAGKIVSVDAPRPSDPKLKSLIEKEVAKPVVTLKK
ncbi:MAG: TlpA disulfide reductase family protein [Odoribacter sp.]